MSPMMPVKEWIDAVMTGPRAACVDVDALVAKVKDRRRLGCYIVPDTSHWADWHDTDAIRCHGVHVGNHTARYIAARLAIEVRDAEVSGEDHAPTYQDLYDRVRHGTGEI